MIEKRTCEIDECDANIMDMILCNYCTRDIDILGPELPARSVEVVNMGLNNCK